MTAVKICGIRELEHAQVALEAGASLLGFVFYPPSHRFVTPAQAERLVQHIRAACGRAWQAVGLFVNEPPSLVEEIARQCRFDLVQLAGDEDLTYCRRLRVPFVKVVRPSGLDPAALAQQARAGFWGAERVLLDASVAGRYGGTGAALDWDGLRGAAEECLLAGGLNSDNVGVAIERARPWGVDVSSGVERDRRKDPALILEFISEVQRADEECRARGER